MWYSYGRLHQACRLVRRPGSTASRSRMVQACMIILLAQAMRGVRGGPMLLEESTSRIQHCRFRMQTASKYGRLPLYWRLSQEECTAAGKNQRRLLQDGNGCGSREKWLAVMRPDVMVEQLMQHCQASGAKYQCTGVYPGQVLGIEADMCELGMFLDEYNIDDQKTPIVLLIERDAEEVLLLPEESLAPSSDIASQSSGSAGPHATSTDEGPSRRSFRNVKLNGLQEGANVPWFLDRLDQAQLPLDSMFLYGNAASKTRIYVVDTGVFSGHDEFRTAGADSTRVEEGYAATSVRVFSDGAEDCMGHGTGCASAAAGLNYGVAKDAKLVPVRVTDCRGIGTQTDILEGLAWIKENLQLPAVISMSLGVSPSEVLDAAVNELISLGATVVAAAGNTGVDACNSSPGRVPGVITVAASDQEDGRWVSKSGILSSNFGRCVDIYAPGDYIKVAAMDGPDEFKGMAGTSLACPLVAGVAAMYLHAFPHHTAIDVAKALKAASTSGAIKSPGTDTTSALVNSWDILPENRHEYQPLEVLEARMIPPSPPEPLPPPRVTMSPTPAPTPAPTLGSGGNMDFYDLALRDEEETQPDGVLSALGARWVGFAFGVTVIGVDPCTESSVRAAAGILGNLLDMDGDDAPDNIDLVHALGKSKATLVLYGGENPPASLVKELAHNGAMVTGLSCGSFASPGSGISSARSLTIPEAEGKDLQSSVTTTWSDTVDASLALIFEAGYAQLFPQKLLPGDDSSLLWFAINEANKDCGFTHPDLAEEHGFSPYCDGIFSVYDAECGRACIGVRYFVLAYTSLVRGLTKAANGDCGQSGIKWSACDKAAMQKLNPIGLALLSDVTIGLPPHLEVSDRYLGSGRLPTVSPTPIPTAPAATTATPEEEAQRQTPSPTPRTTNESPQGNDNGSLPEAENGSPEPQPTIQSPLPVPSPMPPPPTPPLPLPNLKISNATDGFAYYVDAVVRLDAVDMTRFISSQGGFVEALAEAVGAPTGDISVLRAVTDEEISAGLSVHARLGAEDPERANAMGKRLLERWQSGELELELALHNLQLWHGPLPPAVTVLLDMHDDEEQSSHGKVDSALVGGLMGAVVIFILAAGAVCWWVRNRRQDGDLSLQGAISSSCGSTFPRHLSMRRHASLASKDHATAGFSDLQLSMGGGQRYEDSLGLRAQAIQKQIQARSGAPLRSLSTMSREVDAEAVVPSDADPWGPYASMTVTSFFGRNESSRMYIAGALSNEDEDALISHEQRQADRAGFSSMPLKRRGSTRQNSAVNDVDASGGSSSCLENESASIAEGVDWLQDVESSEETRSDVPDIPRPPRLMANRGKKPHSASPSDSKGKIARTRTMPGLIRSISMRDNDASKFA